jgi:hypothetical protein
MKKDIYASNKFWISLISIFCLTLLINIFFCGFSLIYDITFFLFVIIFLTEGLSNGYLNRMTYENFHTTEIYMNKYLKEKVDKKEKMKKVKKDGKITIIK